MPTTSCKSFIESQHGERSTRAIYTDDSGASCGSMDMLSGISRHNVNRRLAGLLYGVKISLPVDVGRAMAQAASSRRASASTTQRVEAFIVMDVEEERKQLWEVCRVGRRMSCGVRESWFYTSAQNSKFPKLYDKLRLYVTTARCDLTNADYHPSSQTAIPITEKQFPSE